MQWCVLGNFTLITAAIAKSPSVKIILGNEKFIPCNIQSKIHWKVDSVSSSIKAFVLYYAWQIHLEKLESFEILMLCE